MIKTSYYTIRVDKEKQRIHASLIGLWDDKQIALEYQKSILYCIHELKDQFTVLVNLSEFKLPEIIILEQIKKVQKTCLSRGMIRSAEIMPKSVFTSLAIDHIKKCNNISGDERKSFYSIYEAERWLDEKSIKIA